MSISFVGGSLSVVLLVGSISLSTDDRSASLPVFYSVYRLKLITFYYLLLSCWFSAHSTWLQCSLYLSVSAFTRTNHSLCNAMQCKLPHPCEDFGGTHERQSWKKVT
ncbi:hypothetical protein IW261DRAFT_1529486 [Armillaria novae-zelandiae]|uniref:Uncharacterized protein n=1 Tax=Armillaria novae-zelandiae TaxID=153914 RepID=A0AA39N9M8_9AGAR|nr:hypothetical protein IW261DRAFT_1529486 [Armillaria novae-zelandiae]